MKDLTHASRVDPPFPNYIMRDQIVALASTGFSKQGIAKSYCVSLATLNRWLEEDDMLAEAFANGRENERQSLHNSLYFAALEKGNVAAAMFLLKARHGYKEGDQKDESNRVSITFNLPGAMTPEQYKTIEAVATTKQPSGVRDARD
jgi:hypothetical protein